MIERNFLSKLIENSEKECYGKAGLISYFGVSQKGTAHEKRGEKNQDRFAIRVMGAKDQYVVGAIADGVGSCDYSDEGASVAIYYALKKINTELGIMGIISDDQIIDILKAAMREAIDSVCRYAHKKGKDVELYCSTLSIVVYNGKDAYIAHIGDDGVVVLNDTGHYGLVTTRHKGESINSVIPLQERDNWEFLIVRDVVGVILCTDGVLDSFVKNANEGNRVFFPFIQRVTLPSTHNEKKTLQKYKSFFSSDIIRNSIITDDITFLVLVNRKTMADTKFPEFDAVDWFEKNRKRKEEVFRVLNSGREPTKEIRQSWIDMDKIVFSELKKG